MAQPIILGSQTLPDASATLKAAPGAPLNLAFNLGLPGQSRLRADGDLETGAEAKFRGDVAFISADFALLRDWASLGAPPAVAKVTAFADALPYRSASLSGAVEASPTGFSGRNLKLTLDRSTLTGALAFKGPNGGQPGRIDVDLAGDSLDVDGLPSLTAANLIGDLDLSLSLRAGSLHIARVGETQIDSGSLALNVAKSGPNVTLKRLSVAGLDGASFDVEGAIGPTRLQRPVTCEPTACTISQCWFRVWRRAIGAGCWSRGRASFRRQRSPSTLMAERPTLAAFPPSIRSGPMDRRVKRSFQSP